MYEDPDNPIVVPLVVALKATAPFICMGGDYVRINKFTVSGCYFIPHIQHDSEREVGFKFFQEMDLTNTFSSGTIGRTYQQHAFDDDTLEPEAT